MARRKQYAQQIGKAAAFPFCCEAGLGHSVRPCGGALAEKYLDDFADFCSKGVRVVVSGEREGLPQKLVRKIEEMQLKTADFDAICVNLCINYGGRREARADVFLRTYAVCSDVFSPVCVLSNCCFCTRPFCLSFFLRCLARKSLPINNAKTDCPQRQKTVFAVNDKPYDTQKSKAKTLDITVRMG